jgi:nitric oxide reductase NorQ protein
MSERLLDAFRIGKEPYYLPVGEEVSLFEAAYAARLPVMLKGPTGCGKTRFVEHMAWRLRRPLITVACNEELSASDFLGRYLLEGGATRWQDGPLTTAARLGAICYLDEVVEARQDTLVVIHPLTDDRRLLSLPAKSEAIHAHPDFLLVVSHNPGYQSALKDLKPSTKQRFGAIEFDYPTRTLEIEILVHETAVPKELAERLVSVAEASRSLERARPGRRDFDAHAGARRRAGWSGDWRGSGLRDGARTASDGRSGSDFGTERQRAGLFMTPRLIAPTADLVGMR